MANWAASGRVDDYHCYLVEPFSLEVVGEVPIVVGSCSVTSAMDSDTGVSASITLGDGADYRQGNRSMMVRVVDDISLPDGTQYSDVLGTFFVDVHGGEYAYGSTKRSLTCYGSLWRQSQDALINDWFYIAGANVLHALQQLVEADGGKFRVDPRVSDEVRTATFGQNVLFGVGTSKLDVLQTVAYWVGCEVVSDADGYETIREIADPESADVVYVFEAGANCVYKPGVSYESNVAEVYNRVLMVFSAEDSTERAVADLPETSQYSYEARGWHKTAVVNVSERPADMAAAAASELAWLSIETEDVSIEHVGIPNVVVGSVVRYVNDIDYQLPVDAVAFVVEQDVQSLGPGRMTRSKLRILRWS